MQDSYNYENDDEDYISKSQLKREMHALQDLGDKIVKLKQGDFITIPLEGDLQEAILTARRIKSREGLRRQMQYIGKLLRTTDITAIEQAFNEIENGRKQAAARFHYLEKLRDTVLEEGLNSIEKIVAEFPTTDRQHLRQLILQANKEKSNNKPPAAARKIFKYLKEMDDHQ